MPGCGTNRRAVGAEQLIPTIGIEKASLFEAFLAKVPDSESKEIELKKQERKKREAKALIKQQGFRALAPDERKMAHAAFVEPLASYGIFMVPGGELETWLEDFMRRIAHWISTP